MRPIPLGALALAATAAAAPAASLLDQGRALERAGNHAEAAAAFESYLHAHPDDPVANTELGFALYELHDDKRAESATRAAIAKADPGSTLDPEHPYERDDFDPAGFVRAEALYNLGLIQESNHQPKDAATSYVASLAARPSPIVRARLAKLDPARAATVDPFAPVAMEGPIALSAVEDLVECVKPCSGRTPLTPRHLPKRATPFEQVVLFNPEGDRQGFSIAVKRPAGWFTADVTADRSGWNNCATSDVRITGVHAGKVLRVSYDWSDGCESCGNGHCNDVSWDEHGVVAIGIGPSGSPSATPAIPTARSDGQATDWNRDTSVPTDPRYRLTLSWRDGGLDVRDAWHVPFDPPQPGTPCWTDASLVGHHVIVFR